jgi:hypothetical protein
MKDIYMMNLKNENSSVQNVCLYANFKRNRDTKGM